MIEIVHVTGVKPVGGYRLEIAFSDGCTGVHDFAGTVSEGGQMLEPLRDPRFFKRVFISLGVLAWPNGFDLDAIQLHREMAVAGELSRPSGGSPAKVSPQKGKKLVGAGAARSGSEAPVKQEASVAAKRIAASVLSNRTRKKTSEGSSRHHTPKSGSKRS